MEQSAHCYRHTANINAYRCRGYIYDQETGLYYLQSRYYDPTVAIWGYLASLAWSLRKEQPLIRRLYNVASTTVLATCKLQVISSNSKLSEKEACRLANGVYDSKTKFDKSFYIKGDFEKSYYVFKKLNITRNYNLLRRNCMQTTVDGLCAGKFSKNNFSNHSRLVCARGMVVPNFAFDYLDKYF